MAIFWAIFTTFVLVVLYIPLMEGYRDGARQESCYNMLVKHEDTLRPPGFRIVPPQVCRDPCVYNMTVTAQVDEVTRMRIPRIDLNTYQCGAVYESKCTILCCYALIFISFTLAYILADHLLVYISRPLPILLHSCKI